MSLILLNVNVSCDRTLLLYHSLMIALYLCTRSSAPVLAGAVFFLVIEIHCSRQIIRFNRNRAGDRDGDRDRDRVRDRDRDLTVNLA